MKRREFIRLLGSAAAAWPVAARAQQLERVRRVGVLMSATAENAEARANISALQQGLEKLGWTDGHNIRIEYRWVDGDVERARGYATELVGLSPDAILAYGNAQLALYRGQLARFPSFSLGPQIR